MICPHCRQKIADGSNICPLCFSNLAGYAPEDGDAPEEEVSAKPRTDARAYTKGSRGRKKKNLAPTIVAVGIIIILLAVIAMILRSMFLPETEGPSATPTPRVQNTPEGGFIVFGATATPGTARTAVPSIAVTPTPEPEEDGGEEGEPVPAEAVYRTLRKGDQGPEVVTLQVALAELGYLTTASDGIYGTGTQTAVKAFQSDNGLDADGIAGRQTQAVLFQKSSVTPIPEVTPGPGDILDLPG